jgi:hypothetical protein
LRLLYTVVLRLAITTGCPPGRPSFPLDFFKNGIERRYRKSNAVASELSLGPTRLYQYKAFRLKFVTRFLSAYGQQAGIVLLAGCIIRHIQGDQ